MHAETIKVAAIDWCPQICPNHKQPGYIVELVEEIFKDSQYQLSIKYYPWSRAIKNVLQGSSDALLSPAKAEAPNLRYPLFAVGSQRMCFFTSADSDWLYRDINSLENLQIGIATDTSIEELNSYVKANYQQFQFMPYHDRYVLQNARKVNKNRIDTFLFTKNTTEYTLQQAQLAEKFREAGCVSEALIYMAFSPAKLNHKKITKMMAFFDKRMLELQKTDYFEQLMKNYGLENLFKKHY